MAGRLPTSNRPPAGLHHRGPVAAAAAALADVGACWQIDDTAEDLFWALTDLTEIDLPDRVVRCGTDQERAHRHCRRAVRPGYRTANAPVAIPAGLPADRPIEERARRPWRITWALPVPGADGGDGGLVRCSPTGHRPTRPRPRSVRPTPTDEPLTLPARLIGTFPVDDTRRRLAAGPLRDYLLDGRPTCTWSLIAGTVPVDRWKLLPGSGFPAGPMDAALREAVGRRVQSTPLLLTAAGDLVTPGTPAGSPGWAPTAPRCSVRRSRDCCLRSRGPRRRCCADSGRSQLSWSQASAAMAVIERDAGFWWQVYESVATAERPPQPEDLADIPIPLTGDRRALGARGCLLPAADDAPAGGRIDAELARRAGRVVTGLRIIEPAAAHPYLERLGRGRPSRTRCWVIPR